MDDDCTVLLEPIYGRRDDLQVFHLGEDGQARAQRAYAFNERVAATIEQEVLATQQLDEDQAEKERAEQGQKQRDLGMEALQLTLAELNQAINVSTLVREGVYVGIEQISTRLSKRRTDDIERMQLFALVERKRKDLDQAANIIGSGVSETHIAVQQRQKFCRQLLSLRKHYRLVRSKTATLRPLSISDTLAIDCSDHASARTPDEALSAGVSGDCVVIQPGAQGLELRSKVHEKELCCLAFSFKALNGTVCGAVASTEVYKRTVLFKEEQEDEHYKEIYQQLWSVRHSQWCKVAFNQLCGCVFGSNSTAANFSTAITSPGEAPHQAAHVKEHEEYLEQPQLIQLSRCSITMRLSSSLCVCVQLQKQQNTPDSSAAHVQDPSYRSLCALLMLYMHALILRERQEHNRVYFTPRPSIQLTDAPRDPKQTLYRMCAFAQVQLRAREIAQVFERVKSCALHWDMDIISKSSCVPAHSMFWEIFTRELNIGGHRLEVQCGPDGLKIVHAYKNTRPIVKTCVCSSQVQELGMAVISAVLVRTLLRTHCSSTVLHTTDLDKPALVYCIELCKPSAFAMHRTSWSLYTEFSGDCLNIRLGRQQDMLSNMAVRSREDLEAFGQQIAGHILEGRR